MKQIIVNAHHHGAFLTINSIPKDIDALVVMVPASQITKYSSYEDQTFAKYLDNLKKFVKKMHPKANVVVFVDDKGNAQMKYATQLLDELEKTGVWLYLMAGAIYNPTADWKFNKATKISAVRTSVFSGPQDMYGMIGLTVDNRPYGDIFYINQDVADGSVATLPSVSFGRPDVLIGNAIGTVDCLRWSVNCSDAVAFSVWMRAINANLLADEITAYPLDLLMPHAKATKKYLPARAYEVINKNGSDSSWYSDLRFIYQKNG